VYVCGVHIDWERRPATAWLKTLAPPGVFALVYTAAAGLITTRSGNAEFLLYILVLLIAYGLLGWLHWRARLPSAALWALSVWGLLHMAGGLAPVPDSWPIAGDLRVLYSWWIVPGRFKYDHLVHMYGFGITTWVCWLSLSAVLGRHRPVRPTFGLLVLCVAAGMGFGALNEVVEFAAVLTVPETNVGGYMNTGWDLVSNFAGCLLAAAVIALVARPQAHKID
jgi:hypothetical protein